MQVYARTIDGDDATMVVSLIGEFDLSAVPAWRSVTTELLRDGWKALHLDMREVTFIDSAGVGSLIGLRRRLHEAGGQLSMLPSEPVANTLRAAELEQIFTIGADQ